MLRTGRRRQTAGDSAEAAVGRGCRRGCRRMCTAHSKRPRDDLMHAAGSTRGAASDGVAAPRGQRISAMVAHQMGARGARLTHAHYNSRMGTCVGTGTFPVTSTALSCSRLQVQRSVPTPAALCACFTPPPLLAWMAACARGRSLTSTDMGFGRYSSARPRLNGINGINGSRRGGSSTAATCVAHAACVCS